MMNARYLILLCTLILCTLGLELTSYAYTANKVWMEFRPNGRYRVYVNYTIPDIKEYREIYVEFSKKTEAEGYYFDLIRGADFYPPNATNRKFTNQRNYPEPW